MYSFLSILLGISSLFLFLDTGEMRHSAPNNLPVEEHVESTISLLSKGGWVFESIISDKPCDTDGDGYHTTDILSEMPSCAKDDVMYIGDNGIVRFKRNMACDSEPPNEQYQWTLSSDGLFVMKDGDYEASMYFVRVLASELVMVIKQEALGREYNFTVKYKREYQV